MNNLKKMINGSMKLEFTDYKNGGASFRLTEQQIDSLDALADAPLQVWVDGSGCDAEHLITSEAQLRKVLRAYQRGEVCPPYWNEPPSSCGTYPHQRRVDGV